MTGVRMDSFHGLNIAYVALEVLNHGYSLR